MLVWNNFLLHHRCASAHSSTVLYPCRSGLFLFLNAPVAPCTFRDKISSTFRNFYTPLFHGSFLQSSVSPLSSVTFLCSVSRTFMYTNFATITSIANSLTFSSPTLPHHSHHQSYYFPNTVVSIIQVQWRFCTCWSSRHLYVRVTLGNCCVSFMSCQKCRITLDSS